jgi:hypothetical protein
MQIEYLLERRIDGLQRDMHDLRMELLRAKTETKTAIYNDLLWWALIPLCVLAEAGLFALLARR